MAVARPVRWLQLTFFTTTVSLLRLAPPVAALTSGPWSDQRLPADERARLLVQAMTLDEKLGMLHGPRKEPSYSCKGQAHCAYVGNVAPVPRLEIPPITMNDGPQGFRDAVHPGTSTAWPAGITLAATWDTDAAYEWGAGQGREFREKGSNVQLGPGLNVARVPRNGRNFEYISGEDPFLGYSLVKPVIRGIQSQKVVANAKHYILNNQEREREHVSAEADERTRFEVYHWPFMGAIEADVGSFMCGYNKINGKWSCENPKTLAGELKGIMGFKGYVMSDWGATHSMSIMQGLDIEMPGASFMNEDVIKLGLSSGSVSHTAIDESVTRILRPMFSVGVMDEPMSTWDWSNLEKNVTTEASVASARRLSALGTVLLKNEGGLLPLPQGKKLALVGLAGSTAIYHAEGSGSVVPSHTVSPLQGIREAAGSDAEVRFADGKYLPAAEQLAKWADYVIVFLGTLSCEGRDRHSLSLDDGCELALGQCGLRHQNALVHALAKVSQRVIVVASVPGAVVMPWSNEVSAILTNFMPGQEAGHAIADILFGKVNPSGKLPVTFPNTEEDFNLSSTQYPGIPNPEKPTHSFYAEKLLVGYRMLDARGIRFTTGFPFGHGLSYTRFEYRAISIDSSAEDDVVVSFKVLNVGGVAGAEVAQLYVSFPEQAGEPLWQLRGFKKTKVLQPGEEQAIKMRLTPRLLSIWSDDLHKWMPITGKFKVAIGSSSRDFRLFGTFGGGTKPQLKLPTDSPFLSQVTLFAVPPRGLLV